MLSAMLLVLGVIFAWLAIDARGLKDGATLPHEELVKMRGQSSEHISLIDREKLREMDNRFGVGETNGVWIAFALVSAASFGACIFLAIT